MKRFLESDLGFYTIIILVIVAFLVGYWVGGIHTPESSL